MKIDESLIQHATTEKQAAAIKAYIAHGTYRAAAKSLGIDGKTLYQNLLAVKK